jgi:hypothetical protein
LRIRDNKVKMIFGKGNVRWARIPQKHRAQFPVIASDTGYFSFQLYLPTTAVEIPLELFKGGKWIPYRLSFDVPEAGAAEEFKFAEESFKTRRDDDGAKVEDFLSEYDKQEDLGQVVNDRGEWKSWATGKIQLWGALGFMYYNLEQTYDTVSPDDLGTLSGVGFPSFAVGGEWRFMDNWKGEVSYTYRTTDADPDGGYQFLNADLTWKNFDLLATWYPKSFEAATYRMGVKGGLEMHSVPYLRRVGASAYRIYDNDLIMIAAGANFETMRMREWNYDVSAMFLYPMSEGSEFNLDSGYGLDVSFALIKEIIPAFSIGAKVDMTWISLKTTNVDLGAGNPPPTATSDYTLWQLSPSFIMKAEF